MSQPFALQLAESGRLPDWLIRLGIRRLLGRRLAEESRHSRSERSAWLASLAEGPIAVQTELANEQHYELAPSFFESMLGPRLKYSCGFWNDASDTLSESEVQMLELCCERAELEDGQTVLDLGCGWGSLALWIAEKYPACSVVAMSNSKLQREYIEARTAALALSNLRVVTGDVSEFGTDRRFDRVVSVEMFEHTRNWAVLLERIHNWLKPAGKLFVHVFCHREHCYPYEDRSGSDWMARHFFSGGIMPSFDLLPLVSGPLDLEQRWMINGRHYQKTLEAWLERLDSDPAADASLAQIYGEADAHLWKQRWRLFLLSCAELFGYRNGREWHVAHYRLTRLEPGLIL